MRYVEVKNFGMFAADAVTFVGKVEIEPGDRVPDGTYFEVVLTGDRVFAISEKCIKRDDFVRRLKDVYIPAAERDETGGVKLASSLSSPGGRR